MFKIEGFQKIQLKIAAEFSFTDDQGQYTRTTYRIWDVDTITIYLCTVLAITKKNNRYVDSTYLQLIYNLSQISCNSESLPQLRY